MKNPDSLMSIETLPDGALRDNAQKLNRLFLGGSFHFTAGTIASEVLYLDTARAASFLLASRVGNSITLQLRDELTTTAKVTATDPELQTLLPQELRPTSDVLAPWGITDAGTREVGFIFVERTGRVTWQRSLAVDSWNAGTAAAVHAGSATYLGA
jgi:hypothetical protein